MTSRKKKTPSKRMIEGLEEAIYLTIAMQEYGQETEPPSLERILSMLRETGRDKDIEAADILRAWHWNKIANSAAHGVLYHHSVTHRDYDWLNAPSPSGDEVHEWIEAYLAMWEVPLLDPETTRVKDFDFWTLNISNIENLDKKEWFDSLVKMRQDKVNAALHITPDDVIAVISICKEWGFPPYHDD